MNWKFQILIIINTILFMCYEMILHSTKIKEKYDKWKEFYEKYKSPPFGYVNNFLPFTPDNLFFKISNFLEKLSFFITNTGYNIEEFEEDDFYFDKSIITAPYIQQNQQNITKYLLTEFDTMYDKYFNHSINEINILEDGVLNENILHIKPVLENGFNKNKIIILFIFFVQQIQIFQFLERNFDLNKIYYLQRNKTSIEVLEFYQENLFNYEDNLELISLTSQFIEYHKDFGFFNFDELKKEKIPGVSKEEKKMVDFFIKLKHIDKDEYKTLNDLELSTFLYLFERTVKAINYLGMANSLYKNAYPLFNKDIIALRIGFIFLGFFFNCIILVNNSDDEKKSKKKKK